MTKNKANPQPIVPESFTFKAETKQLLNILIHSLYKDRDVFLRELISNASDALNRIRFELLTNREVLDPDAELSIHISIDKENKMITLVDTGIGMTRDEIIENLGTIAQSGAREFIKTASEAPNGNENNLLQVIGQFGVGFYSVFMVAEWVRVTSRSYRLDAEGTSWYAVGEDDFQVAPAEKNDRGTKVEIKLKEDALEFLEEFRLKEIIRKHSDYVGFSIYLGDEKQQVNKQTSIWRTPKQDITEEQYKDFYRQLTLDFEDPLFHIQLATDAPMQVYALLFVPAKVDRGMFSIRKQDGLKLYSKNILIDEYSKDLLPEYLRFVQGVVDSEDLPLNVSRETIQATGMMARLKKILTSQVLKDLEELARKDAEKYLSFWQEFGVFLKQGIASNQPEAEQLQPLLRFRTSAHAGEWSSLEDYIQRMQPEQKMIYYIVGDDPKSVLRSPHLDYFSSRLVEVLLLTEPMDSFMLMGLSKYKDFELKNAAVEKADLPEPPESKPVINDPIPDTELDHLIEIFKTQLGEKVSDVRSTKRLTQSVARLVDPEGSINPEMQRVYKYLEKDYTIPKKILELNPAHIILKNLLSLEGGSELQKAIIDQIYESALLVEGLHPDPASMVTRLEQIIEAALTSSSAGKEPDPSVE
ncbi:MAG: molecular chaperone HtpG [Chloroflexi bacterium GWB2_49_20]|nr:MAG: molecular chaperone HtpG [Chloroflexi bacterium GWB2_49_20]OGN79932.1 MAG: molecular chaperone HtpG [Chloroflexi bacterium GWC2_49_37]OGN85533.1 MAG: molecular chaperone HtpG [Chloroflexi bacterium GWD2_49_16]HBG74407.1 molecular chaperone HtpG [Anaerolineae bacterium]HCM96983.1 molecular chaperone HtpG [Anaerolineae bacterium]